ncbi:hypothetical protein [Geothrix sp. PMB-07]|uniref:hypothetical protein n=1 Tax=Geothrix sp. PMB-07 TaxID=3068640 RepID=UPI0027405F9F|nr:hypothetical protein [Geothrix sp. PMB-07]WLT32342.1 hypothetical protein Q9293_03210 [Geothrix sp. PMB-07]
MSRTALKPSPIKIKHLVILLFLLVPSLMAEEGSVQLPERKQASSLSTIQPTLRLSEQVAFFHFVDTISAWDPICPADSVDYALLGIPKPDEESRSWLVRYAATRRPLGFGEETALFLWAEAGFPLNGYPKEYKELKEVIDHFWNQAGYQDPLARRMRELEKVRPLMSDELDRLDAKMRALRGVTRVFARKGRPAWNQLPIFLVYTFSKTSAQGGANGEGIYAEMEPGASPKSIQRCCGIFLHEALHKSLRPREVFLDFSDRYPRKRWKLDLSSKAPDEGGDTEAAMLDEILVYSLADVILGDRIPEKEIQNYTQHRNKKLVRTWDGVRKLYPLIQRQVDHPRPSAVFLSELIESFLSSSHHAVWHSPI